MAAIAAPDQQNDRSSEHSAGCQSSYHVKQRGHFI
jgi:hypothetical protein